MASILPSKRIIPLVVVLLLLLGFVFLITYNQKKPVDFSESLTIAEANYKNQDTDEDGLLDWEESLWGTDPYNADTDGDGIKDGEEVKQNRHPRVPGPNDLINEEYKKFLYESYVAEGGVYDNSPTSILENEIYPRILTVAAKKMDGQTVSEEEIAGIFEPIAEEAQANLIFYTQKDLNVDETLTQEAYIDALVRTLASYAKKELELGSALTIIASHISDKNSKGTLTSHVSLYSAVTTKLLSMKVPDELAQNHLDLVNSYATISSTLRRIEQDAYNPLTLFVNINRYRNAEERAESLLYSLGNSYSINQ